MLEEIFEIFQKVERSPDLRKKVGITALILVVFRLVAHIPAAGIDRSSLQSLFSGSPLLSLLDVFSGGTLANFSIMALGLGPYINASIIFQLLAFVFPSLESFGMYSLLKGQSVIPALSPASLVALVLTMTAGTVLAVWFGELITEYGLSNGISFLIFAGIVARLPVTLGQSVAVIGIEDLLKTVTFLVFAIVIIGLIVFMNEATRQIPVNYARRFGRQSIGSASYLPFRLNQAGVIPIIFAVSLVLLPSLISQFLSGVGNPQIAQIAGSIALIFNPQSLVYNATYFLLVFGFTYFYTAIVFNPEKIAENLQKNGGFIPGIRPGSHTTKYLSFVLNRITLIGALFLGLIAVLPSFFQNAIGVANLAIGGTGILIVVSVVLEVTRELEAQLVIRKYEALLR